MCLSILLSSRYFRSSLLRMRIRRIHITFVDSRAFAVPSRLPVPVCLPSRPANGRPTSALGLLHAANSGTGVQVDVALDYQAVLEQLADVLAYTSTAALRELAKAISLVSLGSSHIRFLPHFNTDAASRF